MLDAETTYQMKEATIVTLLRISCHRYNVVFVCVVVLLVIALHLAVRIFISWQNEILLLFQTAVNMTNGHRNILLFMFIKHNPFLCFAIRVLDLNSGIYVVHMCTRVHILRSSCFFYGPCCHCL